jgi:hypothetical protein
MYDLDLMAGVMGDSFAEKGGSFAEDEGRHGARTREINPEMSVGLKKSLEQANMASEGSIN